MSDLQPDPTPEPENASSNFDFALKVVKSTWDVMKSLLFIVPLVFILIIVGMALLGPAIGNIFSNTVGSL